MTGKSGDVFFNSFSLIGCIMICEDVGPALTKWPQSRKYEVPELGSAFIWCITRGCLKLSDVFSGEQLQFKE